MLSWEFQNIFRITAVLFILKAYLSIKKTDSCKMIVVHFAKIIIEIAILFFGER